MFWAIRVLSTIGLTKQENVSEAKNCSMYEIHFVEYMWWYGLLGVGKRMIFEVEDVLFCAP